MIVTVKVSLRKDLRTFEGLMLLELRFNTLSCTMILSENARFELIFAAMIFALPKPRIIHDFSPIFDEERFVRP